MAPNRRKGANKSTAAAARLKWKVGDLVLAKVKGFPAWPATVSEPQKWGYSADLKKVLVYFFGTQQIAFCNPGDVEEFTEEKKVFLLGKRHGKGSDFVRALNEIIDCFEKLKKQNKITSDDITEETNITNEINSDGSLAKSVSNEAPVVAVQHSSGTTNDLNTLTEAAAAAAAEDALHDEEMQWEEAHFNSVYTDIHAYSTRSKADATQSQKVSLQRRVAARKLRSSSRIDGRGPQKSMLPSIGNIRCSKLLSGNASSDRVLRKRKRNMKSSDDSEGDINSPSFVFNDSNEDDGSEIMTVGSDTQSLNDGSTADSGCKSIDIEPSKEINGGEAELSDRLDFQTNAAILKKRRKPNRKRQSNVMDKHDEAVSEVEVHKIKCSSPNNQDKVGDRFSKEGGDEHLPLVKRARVRMERPLNAVNEEDNSVHDENKTMEASENDAIELLSRLRGKLSSPADGDSIPTKGDSGKSPLLCASPAKPHYFGAIKNFVHSEAALPPSKRLHRALEAMSANVAEDSEMASSSPINRDSSATECFELSLGKETVINLGLDEVVDHKSEDPQTCAPELCDRSNMELPGFDGKSCVVMPKCGDLSCGTDSSKPEVQSDDALGHVESTDSKSLKLSPLNDSTNIDEELSQFDCSVPSLVRCVDGKTVCSEFEVAAKISGPDSPLLKSDSILVGKIAAGSLNVGKDIIADHADGRGVEMDDTKCNEMDETKNLTLPENNHDSQWPKFVKEDNPPCADLNTVALALPVKAFSNSGCVDPVSSNPIADCRMEVSTVSANQSTCLTGGSDSVASTTPSTSARKISASDNTSYIEKNNSNSPDVQIHIEKAKLASKSSSKLESLSSFEAIIRSLTRTKDSIGRATRIAIDCAKVGFATKVVEMLARNLESESSPHKKVDLFFLVDSITQCSGGMKGDAGMYPLTIQALLPRLLLAAAPPGTSFYENHRQCLKVLRVWLDRKILPEPIIRHHIRELDVRCGAHLGGASSRSLRFERPFDDPIREMEGMFVDEYGSNSSIQLPGFCMPPMLRDDDVGSDSDGENFEAVTPEHHVDYFSGDKTPTATAEKRSHILQDVDGELEMEDVAPSCEGEIASTGNIVETDRNKSCHQSESQYGAAPLVSEQERSNDTRLSSASLSRSPLPPPPSAPRAHPVPPSVFPSADHGSLSSCTDSKGFSRSQESRAKRSPLQRFKPRNLDAMHHRYDNRDPEAQSPRQMPECSNSYLSDNASSRSSGRASNGFQSGGAFRKGFHVHPPHPAPSNQFSYVQEQRNHSRRNISPPSQPSRFYSRNSENGNFYRDHDRDKFASRDNIGEYWRPPLPSISGPCYYDGSRMSHEPFAYGGPPRESEMPNNRWNYPPRSMNHRQYNHYRPPSGGPIPVANRGPNYWKTR